MSKAPMTFALIVEVNQALSSRGLTREGFRDILNDYLPPGRRIKSTHSGTVQLNRWLNPTGNQCIEPKAEIALAMKKALAFLKQKA